MQLTSGAKLGPYEILAPLGAGGMGEVYRARDTRLRRIVAVKILPSFSASQEQRALFEREARAISALAHPNICALYDVGQTDGTHYIVMEYLEGETLAERIARGLPLREALRCAAEIADALQQAHRRGVIHRDLKPGNVMVTHGGAKLLDFGLARIVRADVRIDSGASSATTEVAPLAADARIAGTLHYMSPEQVQGEDVDHRSDIFSLGVVLYEMVTGRRPFEGSTRMSIAAAILSSEPPSVNLLRPALPSELDRIISVALEKNPDRRWQSAQDVGQQLRWIGEGRTDQPSNTWPTRRWRIFAVPIAAALLIGAALIWTTARRFTSLRSTTGVSRFDIALPSDLTLAIAPETELFALSPDGRELAIAASRAGVQSLYIRHIGSIDVRQVEGSEGASAPFWSSDGKWLGFSARGQLWKTKPSGSARPEPLCKVAATGAMATWVGNTILFADRPGGRRSIFRISSSGGPPIEVMRPSSDETEWRCTWPHLLPDGKHFLYVSYRRNSPERQLMIGTLGSTRRSILARDVSHGRAVGDDVIVYVREGKLLAQRIDAAKGMTTDEPFTIAEDVSWYAPTARADFDASANGVVVYATERRSARLVRIDRRGNERVIDDKTPFLDLAISRDGKRVAVSVLARETGRGDLWFYDLARGMRERFTTAPGTEWAPIWSPDGGTLVYSSAQGGLPRLVRQDLSASTGHYLLPEVGLQVGGSFSPDGKTFYYAESNPQRRMDIYRMPVVAPVRPELILGTDSDENSPQVSPDGRWLAFSSDLTGGYEIYVLDLVSKQRIRITTEGGFAPRWRGDARELFCLTSRGLVAIVPGADGDWREAKRTALFPIKEFVTGFDVAPDGQSFMFSTWTPGPADHLIHVSIGAIPQ